ncbi:MAG: hypothetical protein ABIF87_09495 [Pseudomonadota bacterium]
MWDGENHAAPQLTRWPYKKSMSDLNIQSIFLGFSIGGILGYLLRAFIGHQLAKDRSKQDRLAIIRNESAIKFRDAFIKEIDFLKSAGDPSHWIDDTAYGVLTKALDKHRLAYESFSLLLSESEKAKLDKAWEYYLYPECSRENSPGPLIDYAEGDEVKQREKAALNISKLLELAQLK